MKKVMLILLMTLSVCLGFAHADFRINAEIPVRDYGVDLAFGRRVVSTPATDDNYNTRAVDADPATRYAAEGRDDAFFYVDLGSVEKIGKVVIDFEAAYASEYLIQLSMDAVTWQTVTDVTHDSLTKDEIEFPAYIETRFVRFQGVSRATEYGYSFYSFEVYGPRNAAAGATVYEVSSNENETELNKANLTDNVGSTRWASNVTAGDNQYVLIDLGTETTFDTIKIRWEVSFARIFAIYASTETTSNPARMDETWYKIQESSVGLGEVDAFTIADPVTTRYIKIELIQRQTSEATKHTGRYPWESTFSIYEFELYDWASIQAAPTGNAMEFSKNGPAWAAMTNITLNPEGLLLAPIGYPIAADGVVTDLASIASGDIPGFESYGTYNPAVIYDTERDMFHMIYRAELPDNFNDYYGDKYPLGHMSTLAYAYSDDGVHFFRGLDNPVAWPTTADEAGGGLEDPRMFKIENDPNRCGITTYYISYTMYDNSLTREGIMWTQDFITFHKVGRIAPEYGGAIKSGTFVTDPEGNAIMINDPRPGHTGKVYIIYMKDGSYTRIGFTTDVIHIDATDIIDIDSTGFGTNDIEALTKGNESCMALTNIYGPDDEEIYLMYGGGTLSDSSLQNEQPNATGWFYALGVLKTTKSNPFELTNVRLDLNEPMMYPTDTNKIDYGLFNKCMFADSMIRHDNRWYLYYGAGDMYVGLATARADFTAGASEYAVDGLIISASTTALNKLYGSDRHDRFIDYIGEVHALDGTLLYTFNQPYYIPHFSFLPEGRYASGVSVTLEIDLSQVPSLPENYYVVTYLRDKASFETLNNPASLLVITPQVTSTGK